MNFEFKFFLNQLYLDAISDIIIMANQQNRKKKSLSIVIDTFQIYNEVEKLTINIVWHNHSECIIDSIVYLSGQG